MREMPRVRGWLLPLWLAGTAAFAGEPAWFDARVTTTLQIFEQALVPGLPGAVTRVERASPLTLGAFGRFGGQHVPSLTGTVSGEFSAWGRVGALDGRVGDGDVTSAWVEYTKGFRVRLGRQITFPGSARYVRFDGVSAGISLASHFELDAYAGWVALPRWSLPRGAVLAGFVGDALNDPAVLEAQNRAGQFTWGARAATHGLLGNAALSFHEQRDVIGIAYRTVSASGLVRANDFASFGGRLTVDVTAFAVSEARLYVDLSTPVAPLAIDYSYQSPALLLPRTSILAAFGGAAWHEVGAETTFVALQSLTLKGRGAVQLFDGERPGGRATLNVKWVPDLDRRGLLLGEVGRAYVPASGFTFVRAAARWRVGATVWLSSDVALYQYDQPVRGQWRSLTGVASVEWSPWRHVRGVLSGTAMTTPFSVFETQALAKVVVDWGTERDEATP